VTIRVIIKGVAVMMIRVPDDICMLTLTRIHAVFTGTSRAMRFTLRRQSVD
jgi:hypothetical protein